MLNTTKTSPLMALIGALIGANRTGGLFRAPSPRKPRRHVPRMVTATPAEFAAHNKVVWMTSRQVRRRKQFLENRQLRRLAIKAAGGIRQFKRTGREA